MSIWREDASWRDSHVSQLKYWRREKGRRELGYK